MFISPKLAIEEGWIKFPDWITKELREKCIQPNAIDFTIDKLYKISSEGVSSICENKKSMRSVEPVPLTQHGYWEIQQNVLYDGASEFYVRVPDNVAAMLIIRSTFNRVGLLLNSGLYDSYFEGNIGFTLYNRSGLLLTKPGTRIGQIIFIHSEAVGRYSGGYNTDINQHWTEKTKDK